MCSPIMKLVASTGMLFACMDLDLARPTQRTVEPLQEDSLAGAATGGKPVAMAPDTAVAVRMDGGPSRDEALPTPPGAISNVDQEADAAAASGTPPSAAAPDGGAALGETCRLDKECESDHCIQGLCCEHACGVCESCSVEGTCTRKAECSVAVCDAGICTSTLGPLGAFCQSKEECASGNCASGVCCESSCDGICQHCSELGLCREFPRLDPTCPAVTCGRDTACLSHVAPPPGQCAAFGQCAGAEQCSRQYAAPNVSCGDRVTCDGQGVCARSVNSATQCYTRALVPADWFQHNTQYGPVRCNIGSDIVLSASLDSGSGIHIYLSNGHSSTFFAFDEDGNEVPGCGRYPAVTATYQDEEFWSADWDECRKHLDQIRSFDVYGS